MQYRLVQRRGRKFEATWNERTMRHGKWRTIQKWVSLGTNDPQEAAEKFKGFVDGEASGKGVAFRGCPKFFRVHWPNCWRGIHLTTT